MFSFLIPYREFTVDKMRDTLSLSGVAKHGAKSLLDNAVSFSGAVHN